MNSWKLSGQAVSFYVEFKRDGEFVQPDAGSIRLTIRDHSGLIISGYNRAVLPDTSLTSLLLTIPDNINIVNEGRENRYVRVDFNNSGVPCTFIGSYKLTSFIPINVTPSDVRTLLGVRDKELNDSEVDLYEAYFSLLEEYPQLENALIDTGNRSMYANDAIALFAALDLIPSMPLRAAKTDSLNNAELTRANVDWEALEIKLQTRLQFLLNALSLLNEPAYSASIPIFELTYPIDPITNA